MKTPILIAMIAYMAMVVYIGVIYSKKNKTSEDYFLGGRGLGPWEDRCKTSPPLYGSFQQLYHGSRLFQQPIQR